MPIRSSSDYHDHLTLVEAVTDAGAPPPAEWTALRQRFDTSSTPRIRYWPGLPPP